MKSIYRLCITSALSLYALALWGAGPQARPAVAVNSDFTIFTHIADGGQWTTSFTLINLDVLPAPYTLSFFDNDGKPLAMNIVGLGSVSVVQDKVGIPIGGSVIIQSAGGTPNVLQGWARLDYTHLIAGTAVFRSHLPNRADDFEAAVPIESQIDHRFIIAFDNSAEFITGIALANPTPFGTDVHLTFRDQSGNQIGPLEHIFMAGMAHTAFLVNLNYPQTAGQRGVVEFSAVNSSIAGLGLRYIVVGGTAAHPVTGAFTTTPPYKNSNWP